MGSVHEPSRPAETVLLVEDDGLVRMFGVEILEEAGFRVIEAESADTALRTLKSQAETVSVLLTDVHMPGSMDGHEFARVVHERWPRIKIVITSGRAQIPRRDIPDHGRFVPKPWKLEAMVSATTDPDSQTDVPASF
jgi:two-component system, response regulator PdtaR